MKISVVRYKREKLLYLIGSSSTCHGLYLYYIQNSISEHPSSLLPYSQCSVNGKTLLVPAKKCKNKMMEHYKITINN